MIQFSASDIRYGCGMRAVLSAIRRSLASAATALASTRRGARKTSRFVSRTAIQLSARGGGGKVSRHDIAGSFQKPEGEPATRLPLGLGTLKLVQVSAAAMDAGGS